MAFEAGDAVVSLRGHDRGRGYLVLEVHGERVLLTDGKRKSPKAKNPKHLRAVLLAPQPAQRKLRAGEQVAGREARGALAALRDQIGGHDAWQKMI